MSTGIQSLRERQRRARRDAMLDAFAEALARHEEDAISFDEIADRAGVSRATVFNYFPTKRDIVFAIAAREIDSLEELAKTRRTVNDSPTETISEVMFHLVAVSFCEHVAAWRVLRRIFDEPSRPDSPIRRLFGIIEKLVEEGIARGELSRRLDSASCARSIVGTYLAELYANVSTNLSAEASASGRIVIERALFDSVAEQLMSNWRE